MICKEDIVSWFKDLESYRRIDIMCTLLNMCLPFELRFLGTCLEELGRRDSQELRGIELRVNNPQELSSDIASCQSGEPTDLKIRRKMALYLALIRACNRSCVNELFKTLDSWGELEFQKLCDVDTLHELLLVYSMATNHPVFSFEQRFKCNEIFLKIQDNKLLSGITQISHPPQNQQQQQQPPPQPSHQQQQSFSEQQLHISSQLHNIHSAHQQPLLHSIPLIPPGYIHQLIPSDGSIQHQITVDGIPHMIPNMALPSDFVTHPNALWQIRPNIPSYQLPPQQLETQHPPQTSSPLLSQPPSPTNSRTASPNRTTSSNILQQTSGNQPPSIRGQQQTQQQRITLRNSRRPSVETTPPPAIQSQQSQQLNNMIGNEMILPQSLKNMDELLNADGSISQFNRNGFTRPGHHTIPRQSKSGIQHMQHHNQQQQLQQQMSQHHLQSYLSSGIGGGPTSLPPNFSGINPNITYALQNMTLIDVHNPILENNIMSSSTSSSLTSRGHKSSSNCGGAGSDSGSSGSTGDITPPETPTLLISTSGPQMVGTGGRINEQSSTTYSNRRLNGRSDKLTNVSSISGSNQQQLIYAPNATSPPQSQPQFHLGNDIILTTTNPNLIQSPVSNNNNNNNNSNLINSIGSVVSGSSNNNLVTSTLVISTPQQQFSSGGTFPTPYHSQHLAAAMQAAAAAGTPTRPPILSHNPGIGPAGIGPGSFRHPSFQIQSNGEHILYPYPPQVAAALSQFMPAPPLPNASQSSIHRSSPSTVSTVMPPPQHQIIVSASQQHQQHQHQQQQHQQQQTQQQSQQQQTHTQTATQTQSSSHGSTIPSNVSSSPSLLTALPFTTLAVGSKQIMSCFNCGSQNHTGRECHEPSLEDVTRGAIYKLDYSSSAISPAAGGMSGNSSSTGSNNPSNNSSNSSSNTIITNNPSSTTTSIINNSTSTNIINNSSNSCQLNQNNSEMLNDTSSPASSSSSLSLSNK